MSLARRRSVGACSLPTGGTCRENPIPIGVYWIDSIDPYGNFGEQDVDAIQAAREAYMLGLEANYPHCYRIVRSIHHDPQVVGDFQPARDWILFEVTCPIPRWSPDTKWGLPTVAPRGLDTQEGDTAYNLPTPGLFDNLGGGPGIPGWAFAAAGAVGVLAVLYALK
jgi:hypothetical protein